MTWQPYSPCPCDCGEVSHKLKKNGHVVGCKCRPCLGKRNRASGQRKQSRAIKDAARAEGKTMDVAPTHEEQAGLQVHYEVKSGAQIPKAFTGEWTRKAIQQAESFAQRQVPHKKWALVLDPPGQSRRLLVMDYDEYLALVSEIQEMP